MLALSVVKSKKLLLITTAKKLQERLAKLAGGVAVINVGAATETEMKEKKDRVEDALHATRAAVDEGIVPGGGIALLRAAKALAKLKLNGDQAVGADIVLRAIEEPIRHLASNGGYEGSIIVQKVGEMKNTEGFDVATGEYVDMLKCGIIDPTKVTRSALQNASSISGLLLTTECMITDIKEESSAAPAMPPMGGGRHGRHGWNGRHDVSRPVSNKHTKRRGLNPASFFC